MNRIQKLFTTERPFLRIAKTPAAAFKALEEGLAPQDVFVYLATSIRPLDEEPLEFDKISRILSRENLGTRTNIALSQLFQKLLRHPDAEIALFAAESLNTIESRYFTRIDLYKQSVRPAKGAPLAEIRAWRMSVRNLGRCYYDLALLYSSVESLQRYYLREAFVVLRQLFCFKYLRGSEIQLLIRVLLELELPDQADYVLTTKAHPLFPIRKWFLAEIAYARRDFVTASKIMNRIDVLSHPFYQRMAAQIKHWEGDK